MPTLENLLEDTVTIKIGNNEKPKESNPNTGAPVAANMSTLSVLTLAAAAVAVLKMKKTLIFSNPLNLSIKNAKSRPGYFPSRLFVVSAYFFRIKNLFHRLICLGLRAYIATKIAEF